MCARDDSTDLGVRASGFGVMMAEVPGDGAAANATDGNGQAVTNRHGVRLR